MIIYEVRMGNFRGAIVGDLKGLALPRVGELIGQPALPMTVVEVFHAITPEGEAGKPIVSVRT